MPQRATSSLSQRMHLSDGTLAYGRRLYLLDAQPGSKVSPKNAENPAVQHEWLPHVSARLASVLALSPNWDGYGARTIGQEVITSAKRLAIMVCPLISRLPKVLPTADGNIQFEWHGNNGRILEIEVEPKKALHYLKWEPAAAIGEEKLLLLSQEAAIRALAEWFEGA